MDQKTWFLGRRYPEESNFVRGEADVYVKGHEEEKLPCGKQVALEETVKNLHEQIVCLLCECNAKDRLMAEHAKMAQEANSGRERAEALVAIQKQELENVIQKKVAAIERLIHSNAALKNCRQELSSIKMEQDRKVIIERAHKRLESKYIEAKKKLANLTVENARLTKAVVKQEEIIEDANNKIFKATAQFNALLSRIDSTERGNNVLKHEFGLLKKELKIKSQHAVIANRQQLETERQKLRMLVRGNNVLKHEFGLLKKELKIKSQHAVMANRQQLETERQKLRMLVRKRCPGHPKPNLKNHSKAAGRRMSILVKQFSEVEEENRILKECACKRENEIQNLKAELDRMRRDGQSNGNSDMNEMNDHFENLILTNLNLDQQVSAAKVELKEAQQKISFLEMELEDKSHHCKELEATCLELQFHLTSVSSKDEATEDVEQEENMLQTGMKITEELTNNKLTGHSSLHDLMAAENGVEWEVVLSPPMIKEIINATETEGPYVLVPRALSIVPVKKLVKRAELLRRLLFRGKRGCYKKKLLCFAAYKI